MIFAEIGVNQTLTLGAHSMNVLEVGSDIICAVHIQVMVRYWKEPTYM